MAYAMHRQGIHTRTRMRVMDLGVMACILGQAQIQNLPSATPGMLGVTPMPFDMVPLLISGTV